MQLSPVCLPLWGEGLLVRIKGDGKPQMKAGSRGTARGHFFGAHQIRPKVASAEYLQLVKCNGHSPQLGFEAGCSARKPHTLGKDNIL